MEPENQLQSLRDGMLEMHRVMENLVGSMASAYPSLDSLDGAELVSVMNDGTAPTLAKIFRRNRELFVQAAALSMVYARELEKRYARLAGIVTDPPKDN